MCNDNSAPRDLTYTIVMIAQLNDADTTQNFALEFTVDIISACRNDVVTFDTDLTVINYAISSSANIGQFVGVYSNTYPLCPVQCEFTQQNGSSVPTGFGLAFQTPMPRVTIQTDNKSKAGQSLDLQFKCTSLNSDGPSEAIDQFVINYTDECLNSVITDPGVSDYSIPLYKVDTRPITESTQDLDCNVIFYKLASVSRPASAVAVPTVNQSGTVTLHPIVFADLGAYDLTLTACIFVGVVENCGNPVPFTITVVDPCLTTSIVSYGFAYQMTQP